MLSASSDGLLKMFPPWGVNHVQFRLISSSQRNTGRNSYHPRRFPLTMILRMKIPLMIISAQEMKSKRDTDRQNEKEVTDL